MRKVICIDQLYNHPDNKRDIPMPEVGSEYIAFDEREYKGMRLYKLVGFPNDCGYIQKAFATLPDSSADDMKEVQQEAIVNLENSLA